MLRVSASKVIAAHPALTSRRRSARRARKRKSRKSSSLCRRSISQPCVDGRQPDAGARTAEPLARRSGYVDGTWGTYQQWSQLGCQARKGEKATSVVFWKQMHRHQHADADPSDADGAHCGEHEDRPRFFARGYYVFNARQVDGYAPPDLPSLPDSERIARADTFLLH
jgi:N-terminal domain of anti-restriction factor ArdC